MDLYKVQECMRKMNKSDDPRALVFMWVKTKHITYKEFQALLDSLIDDAISASTLVRNYY